MAPLSLPPNSFELSNEWGPSRQDVRHRLQASMNSDLKAGFRMNMNVSERNRQLLTTSQRGSTRIVTVRRTSGRRACQAKCRPREPDRECRFWSDMVAVSGTARAFERAARRRWRWRWRRGRGGGGNNSNNAGLFRFEIFARASNVLNLVNPQNFSGVLTSPFFGRATSAAAPRRLVLGMRAFF